MNDLSELLLRFKRGPEVLATLLTGAAGREFDFTPTPGKWSIRQIMAHLVDSEMMAAGRFRAVIAEENPSLFSWNQDAWATKLDYAQRKPSDCLVTFRTVRKENYELLKDLPAETFARTGVHPQRGAVSLYDLLKIYTEHAENHAAQIRALRDAYKEAKAQGTV
jgi:hypothetical protein